MTKRTDHRPAPRIEYRGTPAVGGVLPPVERVKVWEDPEPLPGWNVGYGFAWGHLDELEGDEADFRRNGRRELAFRLVADLTDNLVLADELADGVVERLLIGLATNYAWRITGDQLLRVVEELLLEREMAKYAETAQATVRRLLEESGQEAKRRRIAATIGKALEEGRPVMTHLSYRDGEPSSAFVVQGNGQPVDQVEEVVDLDAPDQAVEVLDAEVNPVPEPTEEDRRQLAADPYKDDPEIPF